MWSQPINLKIKNSDKEVNGFFNILWLDDYLSFHLKIKVSIILMDSQGQFDNFTSNKESASIFSISAFISSVQIYNLKNNLEKTDLEYLSVFADYKNVTEKLFQKSMRFEVS